MLRYRQYELVDPDEVMQLSGAGVSALQAVYEEGRGD